MFPTYVHGADLQLSLSFSLTPTDQGLPYSRPLHDPWEESRNIRVLSSSILHHFGTLIHIQRRGVQQLGSLTADSVGLAYGCAEDNLSPVSEQAN